MISGRGLGHTGGTLDKLEAIPGYRVDLSLPEFRKVLDSTGFAMNGQTAEIAPADKKLYALRDATATIEAIPLIVGSIIRRRRGRSRCNGNRCEDRLRRFHERSGQGKAVGAGAGKDRQLTRHAFASADYRYESATGSAVGHSIEVLECINLLRGEIDEGARPVLELSIELAARMVVLAKLENTIDAARDRIKRVHESGAALETFRANVVAQGGEPHVCDDPTRILPLTDKAFEVESPRSGFVTKVSTAEVGHTIAEAGGGRVRIEDKIDPRVGFVAKIKIGDEVRAGDSIGVVFATMQPAARRLPRASRLLMKLASHL